MLLLVLSIVCFLALSGLMAAVDAAVLSVTHPEIEVLIQDAKWGSRRLNQVKQQLSQSVVVIVLLTNTINVLGPVLVSLQTFQLYGSEGVAIVTGVLAVGTILFSEIIPKSIGAHHAPLIARLAAPAILACRFVLYPLVVSFAWISKRFTKGQRKVGTEEQVRSLVRIGHSAGHIESDESDMIHRVFILNDKSAGEIMTPLKLVKAVGNTFTLQQAAAQVSNTRFSRYPVFGQTTDNVEGVALAREILREAQKDPHGSVSSILRDGLVVDSQTKSDELIALFRSRRAQLAVVQDLGRTVGIVTLDDVLDQLIGNSHT